MTDKGVLIKRVTLVVKILLSVSLIYFLFTQIDLIAIRDKIVGIDANWIVLVALIYLTQVVCAAIRWHYVLRSLNQNLPLPTALRLIMVGQFFNQCLPSNIGGDAMRMYYLRGAGIETNPAVSSVLLDRIMGLIVLIALSTVSLPFLANRIDDPLAIAGLAALVGAGWFAVLALFVLDNPLTHRFRAHKFLGLLIGLSQNARALVCHRSAAASVFSTSILIHLCSIGIAWTIDKALGGDASFMIYLIAMVPTLLVVSIPVSIAGWGVREQALVIILGGMGIASAHAFSVSILFGTVLILGSIPGAIFWLKSDRRTGQA
ncbi:MAG: flippase-like domain-containing protein [Alphaproteobacteria bacterium]|jgi:glycosyltransferase 2 family protein|nr:flippase-like domain-containing protein [Alphaproteobacteria bacterium]